METTPRLIDQKLITTRIVEETPWHDVIYSAATGLDGTIYLGVSSEGHYEGRGQFARLYAYDPGKDEFRMIYDLKKVLPEGGDELRHPHSKIHTAIQVARNGKVYAATHVTSPPAHEDYYHYWHVYDDPARCFLGTHVIEHDPATGTTRDLGRVAEKAGCRFLGYNPELEELYMTTFMRCHFIVIRLSTGEIKDLGRISQYDGMGPCWSGDGNVYTTGDFGDVIKYDPKAERFETLPLRIPNAPWRNADGNTLFQLIPGPDGVKLYGFGIIAGEIFEFDPTVGKHGRIRGYGVLGGEDRFDSFDETLRHPRIMTFGADGRIYACAGNHLIHRPKNDDMRIIALDVETGEKEDYGVMRIDGFPQPKPVSAACGLDGTLYFGCYSQFPFCLNQLILFNPSGMNKETPASYDSFRVDRDGFEEKFEVHQRRRADKLDYFLPTREENLAFVTRGTVVVRELGDLGKVPRIPRGEQAITALAKGYDGMIFGATSGRRSHLFLYTSITRWLMPVNVVGGSGETRCRCMEADPEGRLILGTAGDGTAGVDGALYRYDATACKGAFMELIDRDRGEYEDLTMPLEERATVIEKLAVPAPGEGIHAMTLDAEGKTVYGLTVPSGKFFVHDLASGETNVLASVNDRNVSRCLIRDFNGNVWFSGKQGFLMRYSPESGAIEKTGLKIPIGKGREYLNRLSAAVITKEGVIYGGTSADGLIFRLNPETNELINLGKAASENRVRALTIGKDGVVWGVSGEEGEMNHLFSHDPKNGNMRDLGIVRAKTPKTWTVHQIDAMITGDDGEIYLGERDAISHLITYFPPIGE